MQQLAHDTTRCSHTTWRQPQATFLRLTINSCCWCSFSSRSFSISDFNCSYSFLLARFGSGTPLVRPPTPGLPELESFFPEERGQDPVWDDDAILSCKQCRAWLQWMQNSTKRQTFDDEWIMHDLPARHRTKDLSGATRFRKTKLEVSATKSIPVFFCRCCAPILTDIFCVNDSRQSSFAASFRLQS